MGHPIICDHCGAIFAIQCGPRDTPEDTSPSCCPFCGRDESAMRELAPGVKEELPPEQPKREPADAPLTLAGLFGSMPAAEPEKTRVAKLMDGYYVFEGKEYFSLPQLKARGWTQGTVKNLLGEADTKGRNKVGGMMKLYARGRVESAEQGKAFQGKRKGKGK